MVFQFVEVGIFGQVTLKVFRAAECVEVCKHGVAFHVARVVYVYVRGVGVHRTYFLFYLVGSVGKEYAVAERLAHLCLSVGSGQAQASRIVGQQDVGLCERFAVNVVEAAHYLNGLFEHGFLVFAHGHRCCLESRDVGSLAYGISKEAYGYARFEVPHLYLGLHRRVTLQARNGNEVHVICGKFVQLANLRLYEQR